MDVPASATVSGLLLALSVSVSVPLFAPAVEPHAAPVAAAGGLKVTCTVQVPFVTTLPVHLFASVKSVVSPTPAPLTTSAPAPVFVTVKVTGATVAPAT